ncbi:hypothetical protein H8M03_00840 [Sphingomonas sabuli]|uniref:Uncharacterized protein n=1 Tax=Sphingomonas sabuli TaxID=2764186 RepID=A0A7G9L2U5_9SPHN|nr:hypothetical protein [Sphingomonas sabuli]QNM82944.1 hypothetical protein H8M03_00840 [Sphingomonas sabuli]
MKFLLIIGLIAIVAAVVMAMRSNARVTTIEQRRDKRPDREGEDEL